GKAAAVEVALEAAPDYRCVEPAVGLEAAERNLSCDLPLGSSGPDLLDGLEGRILT
ncbi:MAG: hypothetical protein IH975_07670, partial [Nitrospinae bacterium]|nr:hypothetical protein [Nitrospinota bacterium]